MDRLGIVRRRLREQGLAGKKFERPVDAVRALGAVQAQEFADAKWSLGERVRDCTDADVERAFADGEILRTHVLRPTWHFVAADDIRWLLCLTAPRVHVANRYAYRLTELDDTTLARSHDAIATALAGDAALTRPELAAALGAAGVVAEGVRLGYILIHAELEGVICSGPRRGKQHTYALLDERVPSGPELDRDAALAELTRRYFKSHGPATARDFSWWSGLTVADAKRSVELVAGELDTELDDDGTPWFAAAPIAANRTTSGAFLLSTFDETLVAYKDLRVIADAIPHDTLVTRPIVIDGGTVGTWRRTLGKREVAIEASLFAPLGRAQERALGAVAERFGSFLGLPAVLEARVGGMS
jgi:hypothetical protein